MAEVVLVDPNDGFYDGLHAMVMVMTGLASTLQAQFGGPTQFEQGHVVSFRCRHFPNTIAVSVAEVVQDATAGRAKQPIPVFFEAPMSEPAAGDYHADIPSATPAFLAPFRTLFVDYFEQFKPEIQAKFGGLIAWPASWRMGWVVRNAMAHDGKIFFDHPKKSPVTWRQLTIAISDNGTPLLNDLMQPGDLFHLLFEMEGDRTGSQMERQTVVDLESTDS